MGYRIAGMFGGRKFGKFGESRVIRQTKTIQLFHLKLARITHLVLNCTSFNLRHYSLLQYSSANFQMLVSMPRVTPLFAPLTPVPIDQQISWQNPGHRFLNIKSLPYTQLAVINISPT